MTQITIPREVVEQLVWALENSIDCVRHEYETDWRHGLPTRKAQLDGMKDCLNLHEVAITAGRAALANAEPTGWQPIDTAPKNGSFYLAFGADGDMWTQNQPNGCYPGEWYFDENCAQWRGSTRPSKAASHWLPLPKDKP